MDSRRFDSLIHSLLPLDTRRGVLASLFGGVFGGFSLVETRAKKKKRKKKRQCGCPDGLQRLSNGSCARVCEDDGDCALVCECGLLSVDGPRHCTPEVSNCADIPLPCSTTADCPPGQYCANVGGDCGTDRCAPLCG
jgi:hypothetical protein